MTRIPTLLAPAVAFALVVLVAGPAEAGQCPPHVQYCQLPPLASGNYTLSAAVTVAATAGVATGAQILVPEVHAGVEVSVVVRLNLSGPVEANLSVPVVVTVGDVPESSWNTAQSQNVTFTTPGTKDVTFLLDLADDWPAGDHIFIPVSMTAWNATSSGHGAFRVAGDVPEACALGPAVLCIPFVTIPLGALLGVGGTWLALRRTE